MIKIKKIAAITAAAVMATSTMAVGTGVNVFAENVEQTAVSENVSPRYAYGKSISFGATSTVAATGSITVIDGPARLSYYSCTVGAAQITIYVNGSLYGSYIIPASSGATIYHTINCSAGDVISYKVEPYRGYNNCVRTTGSFYLEYWLTFNKA